MTTANVSPVASVPAHREVSRTFYVVKIDGTWQEVRHVPEGSYHEGIKITHTLQTFRKPFNAARDRCKSVFRLEVRFQPEGSVMLDKIKDYFAPLEVNPHHCGYGFFDVEFTF